MFVLFVDLKIADGRKIGSFWLENTIDVERKNISMKQLTCIYSIKKKNPISIKR